MDSDIAEVDDRELSDGSWAYDVVIYDDKGYYKFARLACADCDTAYKLAKTINEAYADGHIVGVEKGD